MNFFITSGPGMVRCHCFRKIYDEFIGPCY